MPRAEAMMRCRLSSVVLAIAACSGAEDDELAASPPDAAPLGTEITETQDASSPDAARLDASQADAVGPDASHQDAATSDASSSDTSIAAMLAGLRWEMPCSSEANTWNCNVSDPVPVVATLGGNAGPPYQVTMRFRGVVEVKTYVGGTTVGRFNTGGTPANDGFNIYELKVSAPAQSYYLNAGESGVGNSFAIDYTATLAIAPGATVTLTATAVDGVEHKNIDDTNTPIVVPDIPPAPAPYDGQFVQMDVVSVADSL